MVVAVLMVAISGGDRGIRKASEVVLSSQILPQLSWYASRSLPICISTVKRHLFFQPFIMWKLHKHNLCQLFFLQMWPLCQFVIAPQCGGWQRWHQGSAIWCDFDQAGRVNLSVIICSKKTTHLIKGFIWQNGWTIKLLENLSLLRLQLLCDGGSMRPWYGLVLGKCHVVSLSLLEWSDIDTLVMRSTPLLGDERGVYVERCVCCFISFSH